MKRNGVYLAAAVLVIVNGIALGNVYFNRTGEPEAVVELTERELTLSHSDKENSAINLRLNWRHFGEEVQIWFDRKKLEQIGFDCTTPVDAPDAELRYSKALPRKVYTVLEVSGTAWEEWTERQRRKVETMKADIESGKVTQKEYDEYRKHFLSEQVSGSRLFAIDVGIDPVTLRKTYPDRSRYIITPALVRLRYCKNCGPNANDTNSHRYISGYIESILTDTVHVPKDKSSDLALLQISGANYGYDSYIAQAQREGQPPRFAVTINYGKHYEPWVAEVRKLDRK